MTSKQNGDQPRAARYPHIASALLKIGVAPTDALVRVIRELEMEAFDGGKEDVQRQVIGALNLEKYGWKRTP